ncbi:MAG TPA: LPS export ABC transporter periplasmic protein LptC, partial [Vicinamibacterales bacterium]|nr:LPS export ABC transporter periplasmic protein LptC [Vicinamibacterales bacterium]
MRWQHWTRAILALVALAVAVTVGVTFKRRRDVAPAATSALRTDPRAVVESTTGRAIRFDRAHEEVRVEYARQLTYADGSTKLLQPRIEEKDRGDGRSFTLTADEGFVGKDETLVTLTGHIKLVEGDGFTAETDTATYDKRDGKVHAPGDITFHHDRLSGSGRGMLYDKETDVLTIMEHAVTHMAPDEHGKGAADIAASTATFPRMDHIIDFGGGGVHVTHDDQVIDSTSAIAYLTDDDKHITVLELHGNATIASAPGSAGSL